MATPEVGRELGAVGSEPTEIDDALESGGVGGLLEVGCASAIGLLEVVGCAHRVDQVIGRVTAVQGSSERVGVEDVSLDDLDVSAPGIEVEP